MNIKGAWTFTLSDTLQCCEKEFISIKAKRSRDNKSYINNANPKKQKKEMEQ